MDFNSVSSGIKTTFHDPLTQKLRQETLTRAPSGAAQQSASTDKQNKAAKTVDKLLDKLNALLRVDLATNPSHAPATAEVNPLDASIQLAEEALALLGNLPPEVATDQLPQAAEVKVLLDQYLAILKALEDLDTSMDLLLESAEKLETARLQQLENAQALLEQLAENYERRLKRMSEASWYTQWRLTYRDEMETKTNLRSRLNETNLTARSLPQGVAAATAQAALSSDLARPDLEHASQILQNLSPGSPNPRSIEKSSYS